MYQVEFTPEALEDMASLDRDIAQRILKKKSLKLRKFRDRKSIDES
jgi:mRNA-degrading endonuclease RelE of RelBE toxin-antitoxin system